MPVVYEAPCVCVHVCVHVPEPGSSGAVHRKAALACLCLHHLSAPPTCRVPAMDEEPMMATWGSLACRLEEMWLMTTSTVSIKPSTTVLS